MQIPFLPPAYVVRREGTVFTDVCLFTHGGWLPPSTSHNTSTDPMFFLGEGFPSDWSQVPSWGIPQPGPVQMGVPRDGVPPNPEMEYPPSRDGVLPLSRDGVSPPIQGWGTPPRTGQQMKYLICSGQYASCIHAGGLSCLCNQNKSSGFFLQQKLCIDSNKYRFKDMQKVGKSGAISNMQPISLSGQAEVKPTQRIFGGKDLQQGV